MRLDRQPQKSNRGWIFLLLRWAAALLVLGVLFYLLPVAPLPSALARVPLTRLVAVLLIYLVAVTGGITKWHTVVNSAGAQLNFAASAQCYTSGLFGALFLPSIIGGDVARLAVGISHSPRPAAVITGNVADRFLDVAAQLTLVSLGLMLLPVSLPVPLQAPAKRLLFAGVVGAAVFFGLVLALHRPLLRGRSIRIRRRLAQLRHAIRAVSRRPLRLVLCWLLGTSVQGTYVLLTALLGVTCGLRLPLRVWLFAWPLAKIAAVMPITQGGIGVREAALVVLLAPFGAPASQVLATGIVWEGVIITAGLLAGLTAFLLRYLQSPGSRR
ncbi:MAG TPA: lysylphosphatidylglycerol synthase transmembrane domain-containing protein [Candidatus Polarisedimenticolia bacterium]|nr:lysylphosphatidylglycerol synthase transmembrane domain-containing protein [Candidatus Polarisedimenticolia bacterium]